MMDMKVGVVIRERRGFGKGQLPIRRAGATCAGRCGTV